MSGRQGRVQASVARSAGGPPATSTETTLASAWTPVSVRPATTSLPTLAYRDSSAVGEGALDGSLAGLTRPASKAGAVVGER